MRSNLEIINDRTAMFINDRTVIPRRSALPWRKVNMKTILSTHKIDIFQISYLLNTIKGKKWGVMMISIPKTTIFARN